MFFQKHLETSTRIFTEYSRNLKKAGFGVGLKLHLYIKGLEQTKGVGSPNRSHPHSSLKEPRC